jgi:hypothetical protein
MLLPHFPLPHFPLPHLLLLLLLLPATLAAHHSVLGFDGDRPTTLRGTLQSVNWQNPHVYLKVRVPNGAGGSTTWTVEAEAPRLLEQLGWTKTILVPNQPITLLGAPSRDGKPQLRCRTITLSSGSTLPCFPLNSADIP